MFILGNLLIGIAKVLQVVLYGYMFVLIIDAVLSFLPQMRYSPFRQVISSLANLVLNPLRRVIKPIGQIDFTPYIAILIMIFLDAFLIQTLFDIGIRLR
ncbi:MAG: YggT family protein [Thermotogota bacterium]